MLIVAFAMDSHARFMLLGVCFWFAVLVQNPVAALRPLKLDEWLRECKYIIALNFARLFANTDVFIILYKMVGFIDFFATNKSDNFT